MHNSVYLLLPHHVRHLLSARSQIGSMWNNKCEESMLSHMNNARELRNEEWWICDATDSTSIAPFQLAIVLYVQTTFNNFPHSRTKHELWLGDVSLCSCSNSQQITTPWIFVAGVIHTNDDPPYSLLRLNTKHEMHTVEMQWNSEWKCNFYDGLNKNFFVILIITIFENKKVSFCFLFNSVTSAMAVREREREREWPVSRITANGSMWTKYEREINYSDSTHHWNG